MKFKNIKLSDIIEFTSKGIIPIYSENSNNSTLILNQKCNRNQEIDFSKARYHNHLNKRIPEDKYLQLGDVLINSTGQGTAGRVAQIAYLPEKCTIDGHMIILRPKKQIDLNYFGYLIKNFEPDIANLAEGSTGQTEINRTRLSNLVLPVAIDSSYQKKIGTFLKELDKKIEINRQINKNLEFYFS